MLPQWRVCEVSRGPGAQLRATWLSACTEPPAAKPHCWCHPHQSAPWTGSEGGRRTPRGLAAGPLPCDVRHQCAETRNYPLRI